MPAQNTRVLVFGAGSVGLGLASCLLKSGAQVDLIGRESTVTALRTEGLLRTGLFGEYRASPGQFEAYLSSRHINGAPYDCILVCTKAFDTVRAADDLLGGHAVYDSRTRFVLCQNGYGNYEVFAAQFPTDQMFIARIITGFRRLGPAHVDITVHAAPVHVGHPTAALGERVADLCALIKRGGLPAEISITIVADLWAKILYNVLLNALGAVFSVSYGALGESDHGRRLMAQLAHESFDVMRANGISTHWTSAGAFLEEFYGRMLPPTAAHESSMLQDIRAGHRTEIDALNGAMVSLGRRRNVATPANAMLVEMIGFLEHHAKRADQ
jgi:2-dehydropantoate 2-reductase